MNKNRLYFIILIIITVFICRGAFCSEEPVGKPVFIENVKYLNQNEKGRSNWCVAYSMAMLLSSLGIRDNPETIARAMKMGNRSDAYFSWKSTFSEENSVEEYFSRTHGLDIQKKIFVTLRESTVRWIKENIQKGRPVMAIYGKWEGHAIVLVGYDEEYIYINDPSGAFFSEAAKVMGREVKPSKWLKETGRISPYEGAAVRWKSFDRFIRERNLWGYLFVIEGVRPEKKAPKPSDGEKTEISPILYGPNRPEDFYQILFR